MGTPFGRWACGTGRKGIPVKPRSPSQSGFEIHLASTAPKHLQLCWRCLASPFAREFAASTKPRSSNQWLKPQLQGTHCRSLPTRLLELSKIKALTQPEAAAVPHKCSGSTASFTTHLLQSLPNMALWGHLF